MPRRMAPVIAATLLFSVLILMFGVAAHNPRPRQVPVGLAGPGAARVTAALSARAPGVFAVRSYPSASAARDAVVSRVVDGAYADGPRPVLYVASGGGSAPAQLLTQVFGAVGGSRLAIDDVAPLPAGDSQGVMAVFLALAAVLAGIACHIIASLRIVAVRARLFVAAVAALAAGLAAAYVSDAAFGAFAGHAAVAGLIAALVMASVASTVEGARRLLGMPGVALTGLVLVPFGMAVSGGMIDRHFLPAGFGDLVPALPIGAGVSALRGAVYFAGAGTWPEVAVLLAWLVAGAAVALAPRPRTVRAMRQLSRGPAMIAARGFPAGVSADEPPWWFMGHDGSGTGQAGPRAVSSAANTCSTSG